MTAQLIRFARTVDGTVRHFIRFGGIALLLGCGDDVRVEIYPDALQVEADVETPMQVRIAAHIRDKKGKLLSDPVTWATSTDAPFRIDPTTGGQVTLVINPKVPAATVAHFTAHAGGKSRTTTVTFVKGDLARTDVARAVHNDNSFPSVALASGDQGDCKSHVVFAFVRVAELGNFTPGPQPNGCLFTERAVVFAQNRSPRFYSPYEWKATEPHDEFKPPAIETGQPYTPLRIKVHAWGVTKDVAKTLAEEGLGVAFARFAEGLAGISFEVDLESIDVQEGSPYKHVRDCEALYDVISVKPELLDESSLNLYYLPKIVWSFRGLWCAKATVTGPYPRNVILMSTTNYASTTLAHEFGHALAQSEPWAWRGHADEVKGMSSNNLMWAQLEDGQADSRWRLGIGQVFRMYQDRRSWFNSPGVPTGLNCGCDPYSTVSCPKLSADVLTLADKGARIQGPTCP